MAVPPEIVSKSTFTVFRKDRESVTLNRRWPAFSAALASAIERAGPVALSLPVTVAVAALVFDSLWFASSWKLTPTLIFFPSSSSTGV